MPTFPCWNPAKYFRDETESLLAIGDKKEAAKTIGWVGGISLLLNNITGPAMVVMPLTFQNAGWFTPTLCLIVMTIFGTLASSFMCEAMASIPGNHQFEGRIEFSTLVSFFFGKKSQYVAQVFINVSLQCANVAAIIECSQVADDAIIAIFHRTCGLRIYPDAGWECVSDAAASDSPFDGNAYYLFTIGYLFMMLIVIPLGMLNLDDNIIIQIFANIFLLVVTVDFLVTFVQHGLDMDKVPMYVSGGQSQVLGTIMANYAFVTTVPSWCSEKKKEVSVNKSLWTATIISSISFFALGYFGALSFNFPSDSDILSVINSSSYSNLFTKILVYLFPLMILATTIPVFSIIVRYNLLQSNMPKGWANLFAVVLPWVVVIPFLTGEGLNDILTWGTLLFTSIANFIIPFVIYIRSCSFKRNPGALNENQKRILSDLNLLPAYLEALDDLEEDYTPPYRAIPENKIIRSRTLAIISTIFLGSLVVCVIVLNLQEAISNQPQAV